MGLTITVPLGALVQAEMALTAVCALKLSAKSAYHVKKLAQLVAVETRHFHSERDGYIKSLGEPAEGGSYTLKPDSDQMPTFVQRVNELADVPVTLAWSPITIEMLGDEKVSAQELLALGPLFSDREMTP